MPNGRRARRRNEGNLVRNGCKKIMAVSISGYINVEASALLSLSRAVMLKKILKKNEITDVRPNQPLWNSVPRMPNGRRCRWRSGGNLILFGYIKIRIPLKIGREGMAEPRSLSLWRAVMSVKILTKKILTENNLLFVLLNRSRRSSGPRMQSGRLYLKRNEGDLVPRGYQIM